MRRVKHILIKLDEEVTKEIEELRRGQKRTRLTSFARKS